MFVANDASERILRRRPPTFAEKYFDSSGSQESELQRIGVDPKVHAD
jgi:hypothetical protein